MPFHTCHSNFCPWAKCSRPVWWISRGQNFPQTFLPLMTHFLEMETHKPIRSPLHIQFPGSFPFYHWGRYPVGWRFIKLLSQFSHQVATNKYSMRTHGLSTGSTPDRTRGLSPKVTARAFWWWLTCTESSTKIRKPQRITAILFIRCGSTVRIVACSQQLAVNSGDVIVLIIVLSPLVHQCSIFQCYKYDLQR